MSRTHSKPALTAEQQAAIKAIRERSKVERPGPDELIDRGELDELVPHGQFMELRDATVKLRQIREARGLSLTDVSERSGMTRAAISKLENGWNLNPTLDTLVPVCDRDRRAYQADCRGNRTTRRRPGLIGLRSRSRFHQARPISPLISVSVG